MFVNNVRSSNKKTSNFFIRNHSWRTPQGHKTPINIYNCVSKRNEQLIVRNKDFVTWYTCGPTVYDSAHIGHASCYVKLDIIQRILRRKFGLNLVTCMNITDVDDKIIKESNRRKIDYRELAQKYEKEFWNDLALLGVTKPDIIVRVTDNIPLIIEFIKTLEEKGVAYRAADNSVYFDISRSSYPPGKLQNVSDNFQESSNPHKKSNADFALWKSTKSEPYFDSPWGQGRPGWHIECSAIASHVFGSNIDIHAGGIDLRFPHHENEEIQCCAFHGSSQWVNYWIHTGHLHLKDSVKMSKSFKNTISIEDMLKNTDSDVFRFSCAMSHYSSPVEYSSELLETASNTLKLYKNLATSIEEIKKGFLKSTLNNDILVNLLMESSKQIDEAYCDNFNTPRVVKITNNVISKVNSMIHSSAATSGTTSELYYLVALNNLLLNVLNDFGINFYESGLKDQNLDISEYVDLLVKFRHDVRNEGLKSKNNNLLAFCDDVRDKLRTLGINVKDHGKISSWSK